MIKIRFIFPIVLLFVSLSLASCGLQTAPAPTATATITFTPTLTPTPDPCSQANIANSVNDVNKIMQEFDDSSLLAQNTPISQMLPAIADLQRIRREAENQSVPSCLINLKTLQLNHMNTVIDTLLAFVKGADTATINQGIAQARQYHDQYTIEMARLLGITLTAPTLEPTVNATASPTAAGTVTP
jgi:hypothetical protein